MNVKELIKAVEELPANCRGLRPMIDKWSTLELIKLLDEPQPVKVPQFVVDFIKKQKKLGHTLSYSIDASMSDRVAEWYWDNSELFARAWLDGYEVEEEKRCRVKIKGTSQYLRKDENSIFFSSFFISDFTRNDIEDLDFGWVLDCPGIEIEEVE